MRDQPELLKDDADSPPQLGQLPARGRREVAAEERDETARRTLGEIDKLQKARFAGPARAGEEREGAGAKRQRDVAQHLRPFAVPLADVLESNHRDDLARKIAWRRRCVQSAVFGTLLVAPPSAEYKGIRV